MIEIVHSFSLAYTIWDDWRSTGLTEVTMLRVPSPFSITKPFNFNL